MLDPVSMICKVIFVQYYWNLLLHKYFFQSKFVLLLHYMMIELWMLPTPCSCSSNYIIDSISNQICAFILEGANREFLCFKVQTLFPLLICAWFFVYFEQDFYCLCSLQKSSLFNLIFQKCRSIGDLLTLENEHSRK